MKLLEFKLALRQLSRNPGYTATSVIGLSIALALSVIFFAFVNVAVRTDSDIPDGGRIYRLESLVQIPGAPEGWIAESPSPFYDNWRTAAVGVQAATRIFRTDLSVRIGTNLQRQMATFVDPEFAIIFRISSLQGDLAASLSRPDGAAVSASTAERFFPGADPIGQTLQIERAQYTVLAVIPDRDRSSAIGVELLLSTRAASMPDKDRLSLWYGLDGENFVQLSSNAQPEAVVAAATRMLQDSPWFRGLPPGYAMPGRQLWTGRLVSVQDLRLSGAGSRGFRLLLWSLAGAVLLIGSVAVINFTNLTTIRISSRQFEIGIRKAIGARPIEIAWMFLAESFLAVGIAAVLAIPLTIVFTKLFVDWTGYYLWSSLVSLPVFALGVVTAAIVAVCSAIYPTFVAYRMRIATVLAGRGSTESLSALWIRRGLTALQFAASIGLIGAAAVIYSQARFASTSDPGYASRGLLAIDTPVDLRDSRLVSFLEATRTLSSVSDVGVAADLPGRGKKITPIRAQRSDGEGSSVAHLGVDSGFLSTYGIVPTAGRVFSRDRDKQGARDIVVLSELAVRKFGFNGPNEAINKTILIGRDSFPAQVIGVVPDVRLRGLRDSLQPTIFTIGNNRIKTVVVRSAETGSILSDISAIWNRYFPENDFRAKWVQEYLEKPYETDKHVAGLIGVAGLIALLLAGSASYVLVAYMVMRRTREIVLKRLHGARGKHIVAVLARDILMLCLIGGLIALPATYWAAERYLSEFSLRVDGWYFVPWYGVVSTLLIIAIAGAQHVRGALKLRAATALRM